MPFGNAPAHACVTKFMVGAGLLLSGLAGTSQAQGHGPENIIPVSGTTTQSSTAVPDHVENKTSADESLGTLEQVPGMIHDALLLESDKRRKQERRAALIATVLLETPAQSLHHLVRDGPSSDFSQMNTALRTQFFDLEYILREYGKDPRADRLLALARNGSTEDRRSLAEHCQRSIRDNRDARVALPMDGAAPYITAPGGTIVPVILAISDDSEAGLATLVALYESYQDAARAGMPPAKYGAMMADLEALLPPGASAYPVDFSGDLAVTTAYAIRLMLTKIISSEEEIIEMRNEGKENAVRAFRAFMTDLGWKRGMGQLAAYEPDGRLRYKGYPHAALADRWNLRFESKFQRNARAWLRENETENTNPNRLVVDFARSYLEARDDD